MKLLARAPRNGDTIPPGLRRMRWIATGLLVLMAATFLTARALDHVHPAIGFVRAFAEAAMVGGLADWFAVTALFRHPLGPPIPHTAIIPRNKDRIGETLASFLRDNFLIPGVVARRMRQLDVAGAAGRWLASPAGTQGRLHGGEYVGAVLASVVMVGAGALFLAGAWGGVVSRRSPHRGILLTVDGVVLRTQRPPVSFPWHAVSEVRPHWHRQRTGDDLIRSVEDPIHNWLTFVADPAAVDGPNPLRGLAHTDHPTLDATKLAVGPELALQVCRFYLADGEARAELRTTAALDRVASLARGLA